MKFIFLLLAVFIGNLFLLNAQAQQIKQWDATFGGDASDELKSLQPTSDGGYILGGWSSTGISGDKTQPSQGGFDYWVVKVNSTGTKEWDARFGGVDNDYLLTLIQTSDGGYLLGGASASGISGDKSMPSRGGFDYWIIKLNSSGVKVWDAAFGGASGDICYDLKQTNDGGFILAGLSESGITGDKTQASRGGGDFWIVKINSSGSKQWDATYGGSRNDELTSFQITTDGGFILGGLSESPASGEKTEDTRGFYDYWVIKVNSSGAKQWDVTIGGETSDYLQSVQQTSDGGYILGGLSYSGISGEKTQINLGNYDYWLVKIDANGLKQWDIGLGGDGDDRLYEVQQTNDGGYILGGKSSSDTSIFKSLPCKGQWDYWIVKVNSIGVKLWESVFGGSQTDELTSMHSTADGGYILGGYSASGISGDKTQSCHGIYDYWIVKTTSAAVLPVNLVSFYGTVHQNNASLTWQMNNVNNTASYNLQRSYNAVQFATIATITATGNTRPYSYADKDAFNNNNIAYYRLQSINKDGSTSFSNIIKLQQALPNVQLQVYPNPAVSSVTISITHNKQEQATLNIINNSGVLVRRRSIQLINGTITSSIEASDLPAGIYFITLQTGSWQLEQKFMKM